MWQRRLALVGALGLAIAGCDVSTSTTGSSASSAGDEVSNTTTDNMFEGLESIGGPDTGTPVDDPAKPARLRDVHRWGAHRFETSPGFGGARIPRAPGPHDDQLRWMPAFTIAGRPDIAPVNEQWFVQTVSLIGMIHTPEGQAYKPGVLAQVMKGAPGPNLIRKMDEFEFVATKGLKKGHDILIDAREKRKVRMLGGLYAKAECAKCHNVPEGTLLGALSYTLAPTGRPGNGPAVP